MIEKPRKPALLITVLFLAAAGLLVGSTLFTFGVGLGAVRAERKMASELLVLNQIQDFLSSLQDAETGQRGFLITGEEEYLEPYTRAVSRIQGELEGLQQLAATGDLSTNDVERVRALSRDKLSELEETIQLRRKSGLRAAQSKVREDRGRLIMDHLRAELGQMRSTEEEEFREAKRRAGKAAVIRITTFVLVGLVNLGFLGWAFATVLLETSRAESAFLETRRQKELLSTTLASIGDAVIVTDPEGRITFINSEAEKLTGWKSSEAQGEALQKVFHILNEQTRQPAENPVEKVLRLKTVVGLANHTLLIARDGHEIPIDDSAAPIRQPNEELAGVVLVFRDFTAQRNARRVLERSREELDALVKERTKKLEEMVDELQHVSYAITHDMRAPLRAMSGFATILLESASNCGNSAEIEDFSRRIVLAASRLDKLIRDALHYTKTVLQEMPLESVDLSKLVTGLIETYPNLQPNKADIRFEGQLPVVLGNEALLTQCFSNLLGNAVKFVASGVRPEIRIQPEISDRTAKIWVKDNGIGIPPDAQHRLFKMFQRLSNDYEGSGIGLAVVRKVVERMDGKVGAESEPGKGSQFWVELKVPDH